MKEKTWRIIVCVSIVVVFFIGYISGLYYNFEQLEDEKQCSIFKEPIYERYKVLNIGKLGNFSFVSPSPNHVIYFSSNDAETIQYAVDHLSENGRINLANSTFYLDTPIHIDGDCNLSYFGGDGKITPKEI